MPPGTPIMPDPSRSHSHPYALPSFHDFTSRPRSPPIPGPSRPPFDHQHSMTGGHADTNGSAGPYPEPSPLPMTGDPAFDILDWYPAYQSCQRYFLDHAQHEPGTQALCALINIRLPFQSLTNPITSSSPSPPAAAADTRSPSGQSSSTSTYQFNFPQQQPLPPQQQSQQQPTNNLQSPSHSRPPPAHQQPGPYISLIPYLRRLTVTGFDKPAILHGFFGDEYARGVLPHLDCERRNYLFAAKSGGWQACKRQYDGGGGGGGEGGDETVPFMKPLEEARVPELAAAEKAWSRWLAMEDWMLGPDAPGEGQGMGGRRGDRGMVGDDCGEGGGGLHCFAGDARRGR